MLLLLHSWATCVLETLQCDKNLGFEIFVACVCILTVFYWASRSSCLGPSFLKYEHEVEFSCFKVIFSLISFNIRTPWLWLCLETWLRLPERWPANTGGPMASTASPEISTRKSNANSLPFSVASYVLSSCFPLSFHLFFPFYSSSLPPFFLFLPPLISFSLYLFSSLLKSLLCSTSLFFFFPLPTLLLCLFIPSVCASCFSFLSPIIPQMLFDTYCLPDTVVGTRYERGWVLDLPYISPSVLGETEGWADRHSMLWPVNAVITGTSEWPAHSIMNNQWRLPRSIQSRLEEQVKGPEKEENIASTGYDIGRDLGMRMLYVNGFGHISAWKDFPV